MLEVRFNLFENQVWNAPFVQDINNPDRCVKLFHPELLIECQENQIVLKASKRNMNLLKACEGTWKSLIKKHSLDITYGKIFELRYKHFPCKFTIDKDSISVINFLGCKRPLMFKIPPEVTAVLDSPTQISAYSKNTEPLGTLCSLLNQIYRKTGLKKLDRRKFTDCIMHRNIDKRND